MKFIQDLRGAHAALGPIQFWVLIGGTVVAILLLVTADMWLSAKINWPQAYGFNCHGRGCIVHDMVHSPLLLRGGTACELAKFALIWWMPTTFLGCVIYAAIKRMTGKPARRLG